MRNNLLSDLTKAMKEQNKETLSVLRMVKGAIQLEEISKKHELTDDEFVAVVSKQIKTRKESILEFEKAGREDLVNQTKKEIEILSKYMPEQLSEEEVLRVIDIDSDFGEKDAELKEALLGKLTEKTSK